MILQTYFVGILLCLISFVTTFQLFAKQKISFLSGIQVGYSFFVAAPVMFSLIFGGLKMSDIVIPALDPATDLQIYLLLLASSVIMAALPYIGKKQKSGELPFKVAEKRFYALLILCYLSFSITTFVLSGKAAGGHWYKNVSDLYSSNSFAVILGNFANCFRLTLPGMLYVMRVRGILTKQKFNFSLIGLSIYELVISSNRIVVLLCVVAFILANRENRRLVITTFVLMGPMLLLGNNLFPIMRGLMWSRGASSAQFQEAFDIALKAKSKKGVQTEEIVNSAFEADNIVIFKYVVDTFPDKVPYFYGKTFFLKTFTFFIPKTVWPDKPDPFGAFIGYRLTGDDLLSLNSTILGEAYGNFGMASLIILPFSLYCVQVCYRLTRTGFIGDHYAFFAAFAAYRFDFSFCVIAFFCFTGLVFLARRRARIAEERLVLVSSA